MGEPRIRYCIDKCGAHTRGKKKDLIRHGFDINDCLVCPWCAEKEYEGNTLAKLMTGHDNRRDWVRGNI